MTKIRRLQVTNSEITTYRKCHSLWGYRHAEGLVGAEDDYAASVGSMAHRLLASGWRDPANWRAQMVSELTALREEATANDGDHEAVDLAAWCAEHSLEQCQRELAEHTVLAVEQEFHLRLNRGGLWYSGTIDLATMDVDGQVYIWDHKTSQHGPLTWESRLALDTQHLGYTHGAKLGAIPGVPAHPAPVFRWSLVRSKIPSVPNINKDGSVSVAQIDTTQAIYRLALAEQEMERDIQITDKQRERLAGLQGTSYYARFDRQPSDQQLRRWLEELIIDVKSLRQAVTKPHLRTRNPSACSTPGTTVCPYRDLCVQPSPELRVLFRRDHGTTTQEARTSNSPSGDPNGGKTQDQAQAEVSEGGGFTP